MTPEQLDHLQKIKTHLTNLLETAKSRTPGEWTCEGRFIISHAPKVRLATLAEVRDRLAGSRHSALGEHDAAFIASCTGNAEAGWRSAKLTAEWLIFMHDHGEGWRNVGLLDDLLAAWPLELITKQ